MQTRTERFKALAQGLSVSIHRAPMSECSSNPADVHMHGKKPGVWVPETLEDTPTFYSAMHELGHHATWNDHPLKQEDLFLSNSLKAPDEAILANEAAATQWAIDNAGETVSPDAFWNLHSALCSYLTGFRESPFNADTSAIPSLFRKVFNECAIGMKGSKTTTADERLLYADVPQGVFDHTFRGSDSSATI